MTESEPRQTVSDVNYAKEVKEGISFQDHNILKNRLYISYIAGVLHSAGISTEEATRLAAEGVTLASTAWDDGTPEETRTFLDSLTIPLPSSKSSQE